MKRSFLPIFATLCLLYWITTMVSCANIIPPGGGPRDSLPPRLVFASPKDSAVNVNTKSITLTFDEYITLQSPLENVIVSPTLKNFPEFDDKLRNITIRLKKDTLEPNTTYSFNFGESIKDVNEGNIARNLVYVFSTGPTVDYNTYKGKVILAESGKTDSTLIAVLHKNLSDTAIVKERPRYISRINGKGEFIFRNLPAGEFAVYVVPNDFTKKYDDSTKMFAFRNTPVSIGSNTPAADTLFAFEQVKRTTTNGNAAASSGIRPSVSGTNKDDKRLKYTLGLDNGQQDLLGNLVLTFNRKLINFDSSKFVLYDTSYRKLSGYSVSLDSGKTKIILTNKWKEATAFRLLITKDAVADSIGTMLTKTDTIKFNTKKETDYGSVRIRFPNIDLSKNPVLQIVQNEKIFESVPLLKNDFQRKLFPPGAYELRILFDTNKNGVWDTGNFFGTKRQPEVVKLIPKQLAIKNNWDNEVTINL